MRQKFYEKGELYNDFSNLELMMPDTRKGISVYSYRDRMYNAHLRFLETEELEGENMYLLTEIYDFNHHVGIENILTYPRCNIMNKLVEYIDRLGK